MGLFLSVTALETAERGQDVFDQTFKVIGARGHRRLPKSLGTRETGENQVMICTESPQWLLIVYPNGFMDGFGCSQDLSAEFDCRTFNFEIYNGETWWYNFFRAGRLLDIFWQQPRYFEHRHADEQLTPEVLAARKGKVDLICDQFFGLPKDMVEPYYAQIDDADFGRLKVADPEAYAARMEAARANLNFKANPDDLYPLSSVWVFTDFASKFGIIYPTDIQTHDNLTFYALRPKGA